MLKRLEAVEINLSKLLKLKTFRLDSEYNLKEYIEIDRIIDKKRKYFTSFEEMNLLVDASAFYPALEPYYNKGKMPFIRVSDVNDNIDYDNCIKIPENITKMKEFKTLKVLEKGDIVITKGGSIARVGLIKCKTAVTRDLIFINSSILPPREYKFLYLYLRTKIAYKLLIRSSSMTAQPHLTITLFRDLPIYMPSDDFKKYVVNLFDLSIKNLHQSKNLYKQAENLLLEELGLKDFKPSEENIAIKMLEDSFLSTGRLDAEYYQPKYEEIIEKIESYGCDKLSNICYIKDKEFKPKNINDKYKYIELSNIGNEGEITGYKIDAFKNLPTRARRKVNTNDVIISSVEGSLDKVAIISEKFDNALCSTGFYVINSEKINSETLLVLFKNKIFQQILKQNCSGTILTAINKDEFYNLQIPLIYKKNNYIQNQIENLIKTSFNLKEESKNLLNLAVKMVEVAIEEGEEKAMELFIKELKSE